MNTSTLNGATLDSPTPLAYSPPPPPVALPLRDRTILRLIRDAMVETSEFDDVVTSGLPEFDGRSSSLVKLASLELGAFKEKVLFNDASSVVVERTVHFLLTLAVRDADPDTRDDETDRLYAVAANAINGNNFGALTVGAESFLSAGSLQPVTGVERRIKVTGQFVYFIPSWNTRSTIL